MKTGDLLKRRTPLLVTTGSEAGGEGTGATNGGGGGVAPRLLSSARGDCSYLTLWRLIYMLLEGWKELLVLVDILSLLL